MSSHVLTTTARQAEVADARPRVDGASPRWLFLYLATQVVCQLALLSSTLAPLRVVLRTAAFAGSLAALVLVRSNPGLRRPPATLLGTAAIGIVALELFHPTTNSLIAGLASIAFYVAIIAPLFWVPRLAVGLHELRLLLLVLWLFDTMSALVGALQVYFPETFQPTVAAVLSDQYVASLQITLANGERILRPTGLTDTPGGAGIGAVYSALLGVGLMLDRRSRWLRLLALAGLGVSMFTLYVCQVRALLVMLVVCFVAAGAVMGAQGKFARLLTIGSVVAGVASLAFVFAAAVGGEAIVDRLATLVQGSPTQVYYTNRGIFLEHTLSELLPLYPLGAGLARWGMILTYFGDPTSRTSGLIYAEIQWTGWLLDGGVPLMATYTAALLASVAFALRLALRRLAGASPGLTLWASIIVGYNVGALAITFNAPFFASPMGLEFWLLNAALFTAWRTELTVGTLGALA